MNRILIIYIAALSILTWALFGIDKWKAVRGKWRIRESTLLGLSLLGGAAGGLAGMYLFRHKIRKSRFRIGVPLMLIAQAVLLCVLFGIRSVKRKKRTGHIMEENEEGRKKTWRRKKWLAFLLEGKCPIRRL